jgi:ornithine cyclodeaminase/alanine dehydrogenase-like protein (mu-crystallin family)
MAIFLQESDINKLASMEMALEAVEQAFRLQGEGKADLAPRRRSRLENGCLHVMSASLPSLGWGGLKAYTTVSGQARFLIHLYDAAEGQLKAVMESDNLGRLRTGAASGVATKYMARPDASRVGLFGSGKQARTQLEAVCAVRPVKTALVYSRTPENREQFCKEMTEKLHVGVYPVGAPQEALNDVDIVITATTSKEPVFKGEWLPKGTHINAIGANYISKQELDVETVRRSACVVVDSAEQCRLESGDLERAAQDGAFFWEDAQELGLVVIGEFPGREDDSEITLFKSTGIALEDIALAGRIYDAAVKAGIGQPLSL